ncbi:MAG: biotin/lipoyl-containing protein [Planctomycetota bacterium]
MAILQHLPYLGTAEDDVLFVEWLVAIGDDVRRGQPLATVETLKAAFEVEAEADGRVLRLLCAAGQRLAVKAPIAVLGAAGESCDDAAVAALGAAAAGPEAPQPVVPIVQAAPFRATAEAVPIAPAARRRAAELGVDLAAIVGTGAEGLIRVDDVERAHAAGSSRPAGACPPTTPPPICASATGALDPEFLAALRKDLPAFAALGSDLKVLLYRRHGARLGKDCRFGAGAVLLAEHVDVGEGAVFGAAAAVECRAIVAGALLHFGARCHVRATRLDFGDNAFFADDVEIGGGGAMEPEAELRVGSHGFVGEHVHLNPCRPLVIGDEVVISRGACIMTHSFGPSWLRGYPSRFAGVTIGDGAQIGIGAVLFPGVAVGDGAVVLSGSSVVTAVPPGRLFGGVPAVDLKAAAQNLSATEVRDRALGLVEEFARQLQLRGLAVACVREGDGASVTVRRDGRVHGLRFAPEWAVAPTAAGDETIAVAVAFADAAFAATPAAVTAIGLDPPRIRGPVGPLAGAFREFLRKRGVRLHPRTWAYTGGWL